MDCLAGQQLLRRDESVVWADSALQAVYRIPEDVLSSGPNPIFLAKSTKLKKISFTSGIAVLFSPNFQIIQYLLDCEFYHF